MRLMRSRSALKRGVIPVQRPHRVVVHVAVADVAEGAMADAGIGGATAASARAMNSGMRDTGTETSWAIAPPAEIYGLGQALAHLPELGRLRAGGGDQRVADEARLLRGGERLGQRLVQRARRALARHVHQHVPGMHGAHRVLVSGHARQQEIDERAADQLEGRDGVAQAARACGPAAPRRLPATRRAIQAVSLAVGLGNSRSTAAVTMPSVPSAPMKSCFMS